VSIGNLWLKRSGCGRQACLKVLSIHIPRLGTDTLYTRSRSPEQKTLTSYAACSLGSQITMPAPRVPIHVLPAFIFDKNGGIIDEYARTHWDDLGRGVCGLMYTGTLVRRWGTTDRFCDEEIQKHPEIHPRIGPLGARSPRCRMPQTARLCACGYRF
jgi:hypothetical protein